MNKKQKKSFEPSRRAKNSKENKPRQILFTEGRGACSVHQPAVAEKNKTKLITNYCVAQNSYIYIYILYTVKTVISAMTMTYSKIKVFLLRPRYLVYYLHIRGWYYFFIIPLCCRRRTHTQMSERARVLCYEIKIKKYLCDIRLMIEKLQYLTRQHLESIFFSV